MKRSVLCLCVVLRVANTKHSRYDNVECLLLSLVRVRLDHQSLDVQLRVLSSNRGPTSGNAVFVVMVWYNAGDV